MIDAAAEFIQDNGEQFKITRTGGKVVVSRFVSLINKWKEVSANELPTELKVIYRTFEDWDNPIRVIPKAA